MAALRHPEKASRVVGAARKNPPSSSPPTCPPPTSHSPVPIHHSSLITHHSSLTVPPASPSLVCSLETSLLAFSRRGVMIRIRPLCITAPICRHLTITWPSIVGFAKSSVL